MAVAMWWRMPAMMLLVGLVGSSFIRNFLEIPASGK
jgi:hypothetical protein